MCYGLMVTVKQRTIKFYLNKYFIHFLFLFILFATSGKFFTNATSVKVKGLFNSPNVISFVNGRGMGCYGILIP